jgi:cellobiose phosphorylase
MGAGQGGWSWYTGSAAWAYLAIVEGFLGVKICGDFITVTPRFPSSIKSFSFEYARGGITLKFNIDNSGSGVWRARRNNTQLSKPTFSLKESGEYEIYKE